MERLECVCVVWKKKDYRPFMSLTACAKKLFSVQQLMLLSLFCQREQDGEQAMREVLRVLNDEECSMNVALLENLFQDREKGTNDSAVKLSLFMDPAAAKPEHEAAHQDVFDGAAVTWGKRR